MPTGTTAPSTFTVIAIDPVVAATLRAAGGPIMIADEHPGYPCRQCLLDAQVGEELILVSHDPFHRSSPYRSASPIFLHLRECTPAAASAELPDQLTRRQLAVRGFDETEMMLDAAVIDGRELGTTIGRLFDNPSIEHLHVYNATRGCWAAKVERVDH